MARLRGMFAFAIWDAPRKRLLLARDRFGIKPLYYAESSGRFAFASEIKPVLAALPSLVATADRAALWYLFEIGYVPQPFTSFENVKQLPPAHYLVVDNGRLQSPKAYWQVNCPDKLIPAPSFDETAAQFLTQLREVVTAWRMSDVPVGSLLSGGIDSSALAAILTELSGPIHTFNIGFDQATHDEAARARQVKQQLGSHHHEIIFDNSAFDYLPTVIGHLEMPQCSMTSIPIYLLYKACREAGFKVILTGEGADELLGGYHWFDGDRRLRPFLFLPQLLRQQLARLPLPISADGRRVLALGTEDVISRYALWHTVNDRKIRQRLLKIEPHAPIDVLWRTRHEPFIDGRHPLHQFLHLDVHSRLPDFINIEVDRMSMANSVEARPPFLDHLLWEFCAQLPATFKLNAAMNKRLLRQSVRSLLPTAVVKQPKQGLAAPHSYWWKQEILPEWAEECLHSGALRQSSYFDAKTVVELRRQHQGGKQDYSRLLTGVLTTQLWHQQFLAR